MYLGTDFIIGTAADYMFCLPFLFLCDCVCPSHQGYGVQ